MTSRSKSGPRRCRSGAPGFLYGLGSGSIQDLSKLPGEVGEVVKDFDEITRVGVDAGDAEESNEAAYAELVEFVRVGVQLVFEELDGLRQQSVRGRCGRRAAPALKVLPAPSRAVTHPTRSSNTEASSVSAAARALAPGPFRRTNSPAAVSTS